MPNSSRHAVDSIAHDPRCESLDDITRQVLFRRADGILALRSPGESKVQLENRVPRHDDQRWCAHVRWYVVSYPPCQVTPRRVMPRHVTPRDATPHAAFEPCALTATALRFFACVTQGHTSVTQTRTIQITQHSQSGAAKDAPRHRPDSARPKTRMVSTLRSAARAILMWSLT